MAFTAFSSARSKPGTIVENLTSQPAKYEPIESLAYLKWRLAQSY